MNRKTAYNSNYPKLAVQWLNETLCFVSSSLLADSFRLRNRQLLVAAKCLAKHKTTRMRPLFSTIIILYSLTCYGQYGSTDKYPVYKIRPDTLVKGYKDKNGLRQGSFFTYNDNKTVNFIRTYKNDTLNGFLGCYSPKGFVNSEQFYKNGERDGIYFEYEGENKIESQGFYKNGLKHGVFLEFYENGNLKYEGFYQNDTLIGNEIYYYPDKLIRSMGNVQTGNYQYFDTKGRMEQNIIYENGEIKRMQIYYPESLKKSPQLFIEPHPFRGNDLKNLTSLKVEELYTNYQATTRETDFLSGARASTSDSCLTIHFGHIIYLVRPNGLYQCKSCSDYDSNNDLPISYFGLNRELYKNEKNEEDVRYFVRDETIPSNNFKITVHRQQLQCDDTGNNPLTIEHKGKTLSIENLKNLQVFEYDADKNGQNEIYIISYESCEGRYKILKVW